MEKMDTNEMMDIVYAYRYLLGREPEDPNIVAANSFDWKHLRKIFMDSQEYKELMHLSSDWVPSGHFYSPIPDRESVKKFWESHPGGYPLTDLEGIDLNLDSQYKLCSEFKSAGRWMSFGQWRKTAVEDTM